MKTRRSISVFLLTVLLCGLLSVPALADEPAEKPHLSDPDIQAKAALLVSREDDTILYAKNKDERLYPASLTKITTCLLVLESVDAGKLTLDQEITASATAFENLDAGGSSAGIKPGEIMTVQDLLYCMMVISSNEACTILAEAVSGTVSAFVEQMNAEAQTLGCVNTHFVNPIGLHDPEHYTSAWDLYLITKAALQYDAFMAICDTTDIIIPATNLAEQRHLRTTNSLLDNWRAIGYRYSNAHGIKTGSTDDAGHCLVSSAQKGDLDVISVVLGAERVALDNGKFQTQSFSETKRLFEWGFANFSYQKILTAEEMLASMPVTLSKEASSVALHAADDVTVLFPDVLTPADLTRTIRFASKSVEAPVTLGQPLAELELSYDGTVYATVPLVALASVSASRMLVFLAQAEGFFSRTIVRVLCGLLLLALLSLLIWKLTVGRQRYRSGQNARKSRRYHGRHRPF